MKILQIFGAVVAVHVLAFIFIFASPGCQSGPRNIPTPDATAPMAQPVAPVTFAAPAPVDMGTAPATSSSGYAAPTRPGSPNAAAYAPAPKPVAEVAPVSTYTVTRGDSLWSIAQKHNMSVGELARTNNLTTGAILQPGKKLIVPGKSPAPQDLATTAPVEKPVVEKTAPARTNGESIKHTVQPGESLSMIAKRFGVTIGALVTENNITNPSLVRAGVQLSIPGTRAAARSTNGTAPKTNGTASQASSSPATTPAPATATPSPTTPVEAAPAPATPGARFEIAPPPPGEDLDAGLKGAPTEVPTIKVDLPPAQPGKP